MELIKKNRSYRRFDNSKKISMEQLENFVEHARIAQCSANRQPLRYSLITEKEACEKLYDGLKWAGYLTDWDGPVPEERPVAYIVVAAKNDLMDFEKVDSGLAMQNMTLAAISEGVGSCMIGMFNKKIVSEVSGFDDEHTILYVIAFGYPVENVSLTDVKDGDFKYYRDDAGNHFVPKRSMDEIIFKKI